MDPLTLALIAGGASLVGGLPDIIPSKYEREQKKELKDLKRKQELGMLGLSEREQQQIANQYGAAQEQAQAYQNAQMQRYGSMSAQPGQAALGMVAAGEQGQRIGQQAAQQMAALDLAKQSEQEQYIKDLEAAQAQYRRARTDALVQPLVQGATTGVSAQLQQQAINQLMGTGTPQTVSQPIQPVSPYRDIAKTITQSEYGFTDTEFDDWWMSLDENQQKYYGRIR